MSRYVLVHGAWEGAWSWENVTPVLEANGHEVITIDLPGSVNAARAIEEITLDEYVAEVSAVLKQSDEKVVLVGHSMGGIVISQVAERVPDRIERLVYVTAFLIDNGANALETMQSDDGKLLPKMVFAPDQSYATVANEVWREVAFHDATVGAIEAALPRLAEKQATEPFLKRLDLTKERFGSVPKTYVRTSIDRILTPKLQDRMIQTWPVAKVVDLPAGHFPAVSMPEQLATAILALAEVKLAA